MIADLLNAVTPVEYHESDNIWIKRDDLFELAGVCGGKVRTAVALAHAGIERGRNGLVTAGSLSSPQVNIVAHVARYFGVPVRCHTPTGDLGPEVSRAKLAGAEIVQHKAGYNNVIIAHARKDARARGWENIPFGMECAEAVRQTSRQVANIPDGVKRIIVPCGSGMSLAGILWGLKNASLRIPVIAVRVGADPVRRLTTYAPYGWRQMATIVRSGTDYHAPISDAAFHGVRLDPHYEAKCAPFVRPGDLFWVVGVRASVNDAADDCEISM